MSQLALYFHTLKYLKFSQIYYRILKRFSHPTIKLPFYTIAPKLDTWVAQELYPPKFLDETSVEFLNHKGNVNSVNDWNNIKENKLWLYNLHYFDDLNSIGSSKRRELQLQWIYKWINDNPASKGGNGWEAYTLSLRIVNWCKAFLSGLEPSKAILNSLAQQADFLSQDLEKHLLGNHYFVNLKALFFVGCFFDGDDANKWLAIALKDYKKELKEQVLNDGGSFELTPMYHAIMLTDLLDLYNLFRIYPTKIPKDTVLITQLTIVKMFTWLDIMSHGDDRISFFNDSAFGIAPENNILREYAAKLEIKVTNLELSLDRLSLYDLQDTGYFAVKTKSLSLIADAASVGPSYIPGHAHADSLSFELSLGCSRIFVNSGVSEYGMGTERLRQRGTSAHNTVIVDAKNSSEVWSGFRVARRADIITRTAHEVSPTPIIQISAAHNGYKKQGINCIHHRRWKIMLNSLEIIDSIQGNFNFAIGYLHLHPDINITSFFKDGCVLQSTTHQIELTVIGAVLQIEESTWHPEFGMTLSSKKIKLQYQHSEVIYQINWKKL